MEIRMSNVDIEQLRLAQARVEERYAGIKLESPIQGWAYLGDFVGGVEAYQRLRSPDAKDDRWLGVCYFQQFEDMRAQEAFFRALAKGEEAARVNLAHVLRFLERSEEAASELAQVNINELNSYDLVLYFRVSSLHEENNGNIRRAVAFAEKAWEKVQGIPEFQILAPSVLAQLGILYGRKGEARRGLWFLDYGIRLTTGLERQKVKLRRATLLINLGKTDEAAAELLSLGTLPEALDLEREYLYGELCWVKGDFTAASTSFDTVAETASRMAAGPEEFVSRVSLATINIREGRHAEAEDNLRKARIVVGDRVDVLSLRFREILLGLKRNHYPWMDAASELEMLGVEFRRLGTYQEEACVRLHIADIYRVAEDKRFVAQLNIVSDICRFVHNNLFLQREWWLLPELQRLALEIEPSLFKQVVPQLKVISIGREALVLDGEPISLPLRRATELLAYFLEFREVTLSQLIQDLFPSVKPRSARSYFHQFRHQLRKYIPGLEIQFNSSQNCYELATEIDVVWDVASLRQGRGEHTNGTFLPTTDSTWTKQIDRELKQLLSREEELIPS